METALSRANSLFKSQRDFAKNVGVTQAVVNMWLKGKRNPSAMNAIAIERATNGVVMRSEICPYLCGNGA